MAALLVLSLSLAAAGAARASTAPLRAIAFAPCPAASPAPPAFTWTYTGAPGSSAGGPITWGGDPTQCLAPLNCSQLPGAPLALAPCAAPATAPCAPWFYDTYTTFTVTSTQSSNRLTSGGAGGLNATVEPPSGDSSQQFVINDGLVSPASDTTLCLSLVAS